MASDSELYKRGQRRLEDPAITVNKHGHWMCNKKLSDDLLARKCKAVHLFFSAKERLATMKPANPKDEHISLVHFGSRTNDKNRAVINAGGFANWIGLELSETRTFEVSWKNGQYEIEIPAALIKRVAKMAKTA